MVTMFSSPPHDYPPAADLPRHPVHAVLVSFPIVCFTLALLTDIAYWRTSYLMWHDFSSWLLLAGLVTGVLAAVAGLVDMLVRSRFRRGRTPWIHLVGSLAVLAIAFANSLMHAGDGWTAIVPFGIVLSAVTVVLMAVVAWFGRAMVRNPPAGVRVHV
jgi:uncharacterized membrane protein